MQLICEPRAGALSLQAAQALRHLLKELRERSPSSLLVVCHPSNVRAEQICEAAREAGVACKAAGLPPKLTTHDTTRHALEAADLDLIETTDLVVLISDANSTAANFENRILAYAAGINRPIVRVDGQQGKVRDEIPQLTKSRRSWLDERFEEAGLLPEADLETVQARMDNLANRAAPATRRWWRWLLLLQGLAVLLPLAWLRRPDSISVAWVAAGTLVTVLLLVSMSWWLRWRGMQKTWAQARLVAELARSLLSTAGCPGLPGWQALSLVPSLWPLRWLAVNRSYSTPFPQWRDSYIEKRIDDQEKYFSSKQRQAEAQRKRLSRWATLLLDLALAFAFAGVIVSFSPDSRAWLRMLRDLRIEALLGVAGVLAPVGLLLVQLLRGVQELNRRTARFAQQRQVLAQARARLTSLQSPELALEVIENTEAQLLAEVLEWYFHAQTAEHFFSLRPDRSAGTSSRLKSLTSEGTAGRILWEILGKGGMAAQFLLYVLLGRLFWIIISGAAALTYIFYHQPGDLKEANRLKVLAELKGSDGQTWEPSEEKAENGCVIIVHGLHGYDAWSREKKDWMQQCSDGIEKRRREPGTPNIGLVDWALVATPSDVHKVFESANADIVDNLTSPLPKTISQKAVENAKMVQDIAAIRPQAYEVGNELGFRLALLALENKKIQRDKPLHFIGHSAGGFVVTRAAMILEKLKLAPSPLLVTILDTPAPDNELLIDLPKMCPVDFYITSSVGGRQPLQVGAMLQHKELLTMADFSAPNMHMKTQTPPSDIKGFLEQHRWAYTWFIESIRSPASAPDEGFNRSPVLRPNISTR